MATTQTFTTLLASGLPNGVGKLIAGTSPSTAEIIHTCHAIALDSIWLTVFNTTGSSVNCIIMVDTISYPISVPGDGNRYLQLNGDTYSGGIVIKVYAGVSNAIIVNCDVRRAS